MAPCGIILREMTLKQEKMNNQVTQEAYTISPELMPGRVAEILNGAWREFREGSTDGAVTDRDSLCRTFSELIREYHDARESGERQELIFRNEYDISWWPQAGSSNWHFLEVDVNAKTVDCIVGVYHVEDEDGNLVYEHHVLKEQEYEDFMRGRSDRSLEAVFRLSEAPFENADRQPWSLNKGKILYASYIKIARSASAVIFDVLHDFLVINTVEMGGKTLRVRLEDRKMIKSLSDAEDYWEVGSERRGLVGRSQIAYYEVDAEDFE